MNETLYSNTSDHPLFTSKENTVFEHELKKQYTNLILSNTTDETITQFEKLALTISSTEINCINNLNIINASTKCKNNTIKSKSIITNYDDTLDNQINICNKDTELCDKNKLNKIDILKDNKKTSQQSTMIIKKKTNISFSNQKLWEINRVNQILHTKISNGVKPNYSRQNSSKMFVKATSMINLEKKNKDVEKQNAVSFI